MINFRNLDFLYRNSPAAYRDLLIFMLGEFESAEVKFKDYVESGDANSFTQLKHKLLSTLNTLEYVQLATILEKMNENLYHTHTYDMHAERDLLSLHFGMLKARFGEKLECMNKESIM